MTNICAFYEELIKANSKFPNFIKIVFYSWVVI